MAKILPFKGIRYNKELIKDFSKIVTLPYDKIDKRLQSKYYESSPYNFVKLILGREKDRYEESLSTFKKWIKKNVLIRDDKPKIYPYTQEFSIDGNEYVRTGFIAALKLYKFEEGVVLPHERTLSKPKEDRYKLFKKTLKNFEQVFMLYPDSEHLIDNIIKNNLKEPLIEVVAEYGVKHKLWEIDDLNVIKEIVSLIKDKNLLIADGHHRYETSLRIKEELEKKGGFSPLHAFNFRMVTFVNMFDKGLVILPTHRLLKDIKLDEDSFIKRIKKYFEVTEIEKDNLLQRLNELRAFKVFGVYLKNNAYILTLKNSDIMDTLLTDRSPEYRRLDVTILERLIFEEIIGIRKDELEEHISFKRHINDVFEAIDSNKYEIGFILNPTTPEEVKNVASKGERMPQKSTDFYPKLISGLVIFDIDTHQILDDV